MADTSSGHLAGQWAFMSTTSQNGCTRSLPPSSNQFRRDNNESSLIQRAAAFRHLNSIRFTARRRRAATSIASHISTIPSQPVIVRIHSTDVSLHLNATNPQTRTSHSMSRGNELPPVSDFSVEGILATIQPNIDGTIDEIAEILGRSRLTLANEYDSHMPPQGEIRASSRHPLLPVSEASSSNERLAADNLNVLIVDDEASVVAGSYTGSAAYGLLERFGVPPRPRRPPRPLNDPSTVALSQAPLAEPLITVRPIPSDRSTRSPTTSRRLLRTTDPAIDHAIRPTRATNAVVSETYLLAGANGRPASNPPIVSEAGRNYPLYSYDESDLFESVPELVPPNRFRALQSRMQSLSLVSDLQGLAAWLYREPSIAGEHREDAERRLRAILDRQSAPPAPEEGVLGELYE